MLKRTLLLLALAVSSLAFGQTTPSTSALVTDKTGAVVPQYWDSTALQYVVASQATPAPITTANYSYNHIGTSAATIVKGAPGSLHAISVNTKGSSTSSATIYDNASSCSGTVLGIIDSLNLSGLFVFDAQMASGICVRTTGAPDITVIYK